MHSAEMICTSLLMLILMIRHKVSSFFWHILHQLAYIYIQMKSLNIFMLTMHCNDGEQYKIDSQWSSYK